MQNKYKKTAKTSKVRKLRIKNEIRNLYMKKQQLNETL
jgi:hypothetical protein